MDFLRDGGGSAEHGTRLSFPFDALMPGYRTVTYCVPGASVTGDGITGDGSTYERPRYTHGM